LRRLIKTCALVVIGVVITTTTAGVSRADIVLDSAFPVEKQTTRVHVSGADGLPVTDAALAVTYRPGSAVPATFEIGRTAADGNCDWTPREAGIVTINAVWVDADGVEQTAAVNSSVKYNPTPIAGVVIMIAAGLVLIGGSVVRIMRLLGTPESD
jgi:hypothetical protein